MTNFMICVFIDDKGGETPESVENVIDVPCNAPGVLPIDEYFRLQENCLDSYKAKTNIQYNHFKEELKKQGALRIPCIQKYFTQIKDIDYSNSPYHRGMKLLYISISLGIIGLLLTLTFVKELFIDFKGKTGKEKVNYIICIICGLMSIINGMIYFVVIKALAMAPGRSFLAVQS
uniref:Uncharacterized protein n=1 Tax=Panagrolaimus davidi TaxID=227884 RepID=A0A914PXX6_9BILA